MSEKYTKWVACWGNATSIIDQKECTFSKNLTLRYPIRMCFSGSRLRFHFSNLTGTEPIELTRVFVSGSDGNSSINPETLTPVTFDGQASVSIEPGTERMSDEIDYMVTAGEKLAVSIYLEKYTDMNAGVLISGPLSKGYYAYGDFAGAESLPRDLTRNTKWFYFLNTVDIFTEDKNHALVVYGDSITAQSWPDYLAQRAWEQGFRHISIIRRAVSGTRILREYHCITYAAYGLKGENRFQREIQVSGADAVLIQHGINDIIHPVGTQVNVFRPWSDLPTVEEMIAGMEEIYVKPAREKGLKVYAGTLLPIYNWRTYAPFREEMRNRFNDYLRNADGFDGCVDFDEAVRDPAHPERFAEGFDSGDHLHPSEEAYQAMADCVMSSELFAKELN